MKPMELFKLMAGVIAELRAEVAELKAENAGLRGALARIGKEAV